LKKKDSIKQRLGLLSFLCLILVFSLLNTMRIWSIDAPITKALLKKIPFDFNMNTIRKIVPMQDYFYILDSGNHRILKTKGKSIEGEIGIIGNGKGEIYYPEDMIFENNLFYILDRGNHRIQIIDIDGKPVGMFPENPVASGIASNSSNMIFLGQATQNKLISVYDVKGNVVSRFGELIKPSEVFGLSYIKNDSTHIIPMNRVYLQTDNSDNIWVAYYHMPVICAYSSTGKPILKKIIQLQGFEKIKNAVWNPSPHSNFLSIGMDGVTLSLFINDFCFQPTLNRFYLVLGDNRILKLDPSGNIERIIKPRVLKGAIEKIGVDSKEQIFVSFFFSSEIYQLEYIQSK